MIYSWSRVRAAVLCRFGHLKPSSRRESFFGRRSGNARGNDVRRLASLVVIIVICLWIAVEWSSGDHDMPRVAYGMLLLLFGLSAWYEWKDLSNGSK